MDKDYKPKEIEKNVQELWKKSEAFKTDLNNSKNKFYCFAGIPTLTDC